MLQNLEFWLKMRALQQKVCKIQGFLVKNLEISKVFTPPTGYATAPRLLLRFYVTIFGIFKQNWTKKKFFLVKILQICKVFTAPTGYSTAARLLSRFYVTIFGIFKQNQPKKKLFSSQNSSNLQGLYSPNRKWHSCKAFIAFLSDNIFNFEAK